MKYITVRLTEAQIDTIIDCLEDNSVKTAIQQGYLGNPVNQEGAFKLRLQTKLAKAKTV